MDSDDIANIGPDSWKRSGLVELNEGGREKRWWRWWLWPLAIAAIIIAALLTIRDVSADTAQQAREILNENGIGNIDIDANYRNVDVSGELPAGVTAAQVEALLEADPVDGEHADIINADTSGLVAAAPAALGPIDVDVDSDGEVITLSGTVPSEAHEAELVTAAEGTGLEVVNNLTVSGNQPSAADADGQIGNLAGVIGGLGVGTFVAANLNLDDDGPTTGTIEAIDLGAASGLEASSGDGVTVTAPPAPDLGAIDTQVDYDGNTIVLNGTVLSDAQAASLVAAAADVVGEDNVVNNLEVSGLDEAVEGADGRVDSLATAIATFGGLDEANGSLTDTDLTVNGIASNDAAKAATDGTIAAAADSGVRPGGEITVPEAEISLEEEIDLLQAELDALQDEIRENVVFASDSDELTPVAQGTLDKVVLAMNRYPRPVVEVGGHTDSQGDDAYNLDLSQRRAQSVVDYVGAGTSPDRLSPVGFGESQPVADNTIEEGRLQNRRVEFIAKESF